MLDCVDTSIIKDNLPYSLIYSRTTLLLYPLRTNRTQDHREPPRNPLLNLTQLHNRTVPGPHLVRPLRTNHSTRRKRLITRTVRGTTTLTSLRSISVCISNPKIVVAGRSLVKTLSKRDPYLVTPEGRKFRWRSFSVARKKHFRPDL